MEHQARYRLTFAALAALQGVETLLGDSVKAFLPMAGSEMAQTGIVLILVFAFSEWADIRRKA